MNSSDNIGRLAVAAAVIGTFLVFGAGGAQAASTHAVAASGVFAAEETPSDGDQTPSDEESSDNSDEISDSDSDTDTTDSDSDQPTDEPTDEPTFGGTPTTGTTDDSTEMPTDDASETSEAGQSPLGWILLGGGVACAVAAFLVYRRNRHIM
ncbi:MAG TPA: hypothetical protein VMZ66_12990 [Aeromicrobium sp.]|nr:hypothetical protein [Aeromicrobium sp.]